MGPLIESLQVARWQSIFINRGLNPLFHDPILLLILNYHIKNPIVPNHKKRKRHTNPICFIWVRFSNRRRDYWRTSRTQVYQPLSSQAGRTKEWALLDMSNEKKWMLYLVLVQKNMGCISYKPTNLGYTLYFPWYFDMNGILFWPAPSVTWDPFGMGAASASELSLNQLWKIPKVRVSKITREQ